MIMGAWILVTVGAAAPSTGRPLQQPVSWLGEDGAPLPFRTDAEIEAFLASAEVVDSESLPVGITGPRRLTLEKDGVRAAAVFRHFDRKYDDRTVVGGRMYVDLTDSYRFEPLAYRLARLLGIDCVPTAIIRRVGRQDGSVQIWVYGSYSELDRAEQQLTPPNAARWVRQRQQMLLFDLLIGNVDRNAGNILYDEAWKMWLIDHTRAFYTRAPLDELDALVSVQRTVWERLRGLQAAQMEAELGALLSGVRAGWLLERRDRIVEHLQGLIDEYGAEAVIYDDAAEGDEVIPAATR